MKRILFSGLLVAGLLISVSGFSQRHYGYHRGYGFPHPRAYFHPIPAPVYYPPVYPVYPRVYAPVYGYGYGYREPYYYGRGYRGYRDYRGYQRSYYRGGYYPQRGRGRRI